MSALTEGAVGTDLTALEDLDFDIEVPCDIQALRRETLGGYPDCQGDKAEWVAWRTACCANSPRYRLMCTFCKRTYQNWQARGAAIICISCGTETGGFIAFTPLNKSPR